MSGSSCRTRRQTAGGCWPEEAIRLADTFWKFFLRPGRLIAVSFDGEALLPSKRFDRSVNVVFIVLFVARSSVKNKLQIMMSFWYDLWL